MESGAFTVAPGLLVTSDTVSGESLKFSRNFSMPWLHVNCDHSLGGSLAMSPCVVTKQGGVFLDEWTAK